MPQNLNEQEEDEQCDSGSGSIDSNEPPPLVVDETVQENRKLQTTRNVLTKSVNIKLNKLEWPIDDDLISSVTEDSSGSSYVGFGSIFYLLTKKFMRLFLNELKLNYRIPAM